MNWRHETWRKLFVREEGSFAGLSFTARALAGQLLKLCDDRGRIHAGPGKVLVEEICFRLRASRGERRLIRPAFVELIDDEHVLVSQDGSWCRLKNFAAAQGRLELVDPPAGNEADTNGTRPRLDGASTATPMRFESDANVSRPCNEDCVNPAVSLKTEETVPSVPSGPSVPSEKPGSCGEPARAPASPPQQLELTPTGPEPERLLTYPTVAGAKNGPREWHLTPRELALLEQGYPDLNVMAECRKALVWCEAKPAERKTATGMLAFLNGWMANAQNGGGGRRAPARPAPAGNGNAPGDRPCSFHEHGRNTGRWAPKPVVSRACSECRHLLARASPRQSGGPEAVGELMRGR